MNKYKYLLLITFIVIFLTSCSGSQTVASSSSFGKGLADDFIKEYKTLSQEFDSKMLELSEEFDDLKTIPEGIENLDKRIEIQKKYKSDLMSLIVPEIFKDFYTLKLEELDYGINFFESTKSFYQDGYPEIEELQKMQIKLYELSEKSNEEAMNVVKSNNLDF